MKNYIFAFLFGVAVTISLAATTTDLLTIKPAKPTQTIAFAGSAYAVDEFVEQYNKLGYQINSVTATTTANMVIVIMEKY